MFPKFLRLGPLVFAYLSLLTVGLFILAATKLSNCYFYTLVGLGLQLFLVYMVVAMRILKKSKSYRKKYLSQLISQPDGSFKATLVWNNVNIVAVVVLLCIPPAYDMAMLAGLQYNENAADTVKDCHFTLYTVCLFMEINNHAIGYYEFMAVWLLYVSGLFLGLLLFYIFFRYYYLYYKNLLHNKRMVQTLQLAHIESLLDCHVYKIQVKYGQNMDEEIGDCAICLHHFLKQTNNNNNENGNKHSQYKSSDLETNLLESYTGNYEPIVKLRCNHLFHRECIVKWLKVRDSCPFKCEL